MSRVVEDQTPAEHLLREWLPADRDEVLEDINLLEQRGLEVVYADLHSEGQGIVFLAVPVADEVDRAHHPQVMAWFSAHHGGHHVRYLALKHLVAVSLDEEKGETRLSLHFAPPISTITVLARTDPQRGQARQVADTLQGWLVRGWL